MKRSRKRRLAAAVIGIAGILVIAAVLAGHFLPRRYRSDFQDEKNWTAYTGSQAAKMTAAKGALTMEPGLGNKWLSNKQEVTDFAASVTISFQNQGQQEAAPDAGLLFRVVADAKAAGDVAEGYYFGIDTAKQQVFLKRGDAAAGEWAEIATKRIKVLPKTDYRLTVKAFGDHILGYVNETDNSWPVIDVVDEDFAAGKIGVQNQEALTRFTDFTVADYQAPTIKGKTYLNALLPEAADPDILYWEGTYYLYPTTPGRNIGGIKVYTSKDLVNWEDAGMAMTAGPDNWGDQGFWAPDLIERDGRFYMYYTANEHLCVSVADSPLGPFKQISFGPLHEDIQEIDAHAFKDDDGQYYLYFVRFDNGNHIWGAKLNDDMATIDEASVVKVLAPSQPWELDMGNINEGPYMLKHDGKYYLTYSGSHFESPLYGAGYAVGDSPLGPFEKYAENPIMQSNSLAHGTGHHAVAESPDGKELFMIYHRHQTLFNTDPREFAIDRMRFTKNDQGETVLEVYGPTVTPQPYPSGAPGGHD